VLVRQAGGNDMERQTIIITGASDGIGAAAARQLTAKGERVALAGRSPAKTAAVADELGAPYHLADYADLDQVRSLASDLRATYPRIDVLANNAGGIMGGRELTKDGFEKTFQVNHLAPFLLTHLLMPILISSQAKVLQTSSVAAQRYGHVDIDDLQNEKNYAPLKAYGTGKLENILFTRELHRRFHDQGLSAAAFHPGVVATSFASDTTHLMRYFYHSPLTRLFTISPAQGAEPLVWLAEGTPGRTWQSGGYYAKNKPARTNAQADDPHLAQLLWDRSAAMLKLWMVD
jgi:NAD(P)-dependent dehydrogenase (short-subunit alcohol dehydrogenase family)